MGLFDKIAGPLIGAGSDLLGGVLGRQADKDNISRQYRDSKEFAQQGVRWRVEDARQAGIDPLAALGASIPSGPTYYSGSGSGVGSAMRGVGANLSRAAAATMTPDERMHQHEMNHYARERAQLENDWLRMQLAGSAERTMFQPGQTPFADTVGERVTSEVPGSLEAYSQQPAGWAGQQFGDFWHTTSGPLTQTIEDHYGEIPKEIYGWGKALVDAFYNADRARRYMMERHRRAVVPPADPYGIYGGP